MIRNGKRYEWDEYAEEWVPAGRAERARAKVEAAIARRLGSIEAEASPPPAKIAFFPSAPATLTAPAEKSRVAAAGQAGGEFQLNPPSDGERGDVR